MIKKTQMIEVVLPDAGSMLRAGLAPLTPVELERRRLAPTAQLVPWNEDQRAAARKRYGIDRIVEITDGYELSTFEDVARPAAEDLWTLSSASLRDDVVNTLRSPFQDSPDFPGGSGVSCQSGGEGSTSCSVTSCGGQGGGCQISCSAGWFSCCNCGTPPTCYCIRN